MKLSNMLYETVKKKRKVSLAVLTHNGKVLILKRSMNERDRHAGRWGFPGGGIDMGETPLEAIKRECREEIGVRPIGLKLLDTIDNITWFSGRLPTDPEECIRLNREHSDWEMVDSQSIYDFDTIDGMPEMVRIVLHEDI